jgi:hypothetical protein
MSLLLKVVAEGIDPLMASFELGLCVSPPPTPGAKTPKIFLLSASGNVRNLDLRHVTILYTAHPTAAPSGNTRVCRPERLPHTSAGPAPAPPGDD